MSDSVVLTLFYFIEVTAREYDVLTVYVLFVCFHTLSNMNCAHHDVYRHSEYIPKMQMGCRNTTKGSVMRKSNDERIIG